MYFEPKINPMIPVLVDHPFISSLYMQINGDVCNILESKENYNNFIEEIKRKIDSETDCKNVYFLIQKSFRSAFLKYTHNYLSNEDLGKVLKMYWQNNDSVNVDANISKLQYVKLFKKCGRENLMTKEELEAYEKMPDKIEIYRGINNFSKHPVNGLSWTTDKDQALWFAKRFKETGTLCKTTIEKEHILAYFSYENETVIDIHFLKDVVKEIVI